jgi:steroid delta-isomerase-like uncharacterized protein
MIVRRVQVRTLRSALLVTLALSSLTACARRTAVMDQATLSDFATRYAAAWSGGDPEALASFYTEEGSLTVNDGAPSRGREAIATTAGAFMEAFPDMVVTVDSVNLENSHAIFRWTWTGTNSGPGGTGNAVAISGYEVWTLSGDGLIRESKGHYDEAEYQRQITGHHN